MHHTPRHEVALPLIVGVTGHRNIRPQDVAELEAKVEQVLLAIRAEWVGKAADENPGPLTLLTGLASGADELVARVATRPHIGAKIVAGLPMPRHLYERDFETPAQLKAFHEMLAKAQVFELPLLEGS